MNTDLDPDVEFSERAEPVDRSMFATERARTFASFSSASPPGFAEENPEPPDDWAKPARGVDPFTLAAGLSVIGLVVIALVAMGALVSYQYLRELVRLEAKSRQIEQIATVLAGLQARVDAIEADRTTADRSVGAPAELRGDEASSPAFSAAIAQISARLDRVRDEATVHFEGLALRLDKLEANAAAPVAAAAPVEATTRASAATQSVAAADPTGSTPPEKHALRGFTIRRVHDGVASIRGPDGESSVSVGDDLPGAGKVLGIDRRGRGWVVITSGGIIKSASRPAKARRSPRA